MIHGSPTAYTPEGMAAFADGAVCRARDWLAYEQGRDSEPCYHLPRFTRDEFRAMVKAWNPETTKAVAMFDPPLWIPDALDWECGEAIFNLALDRSLAAEEQERLKNVALNLPAEAKQRRRAAGFGDGEVPA